MSGGKIAGWSKVNDGKYLQWEHDHRDMEVTVEQKISNPSGKSLGWAVNFFGSETPVSLEREYEDVYDTKEKAREKAVEALRKVDPRPDMKKMKKEAYEMGRKRAKGIGDAIPEKELQEEGVSRAISESLAQFRQSSKYANFTMPELRKMAGFDDSGTGTYRDGGHEENMRLDELVERFEEGYHDQAAKELRGE